MEDKDKYEIILELSRASVNTYDLLKDILNWMRVSEDNLYNFNPTNVKIFSLVQNVYEHLHLQLENKKQKFINNINRDHILNIDANLMSTIIRNLLTNASKYSELDRKITIYSKVTDNNYIICIEDEGIGMKKELIDLLKDNSYSSILQLDVKENSFGYGVVICKDFMKVHNGWLEYESDGKTGTIAKLIFERSTLVKGA
jgi:K+-sensing histidine kinase KdpD